MAFNIETTLVAIETYLKDQGSINQVVIGQLRSAPNQKLVASIFMRSLDIVQLSLGTTIEVQTVIVRLQMNLLTYQPREIELLLAKVSSEIIEDLAGDFDLGATIRNVDLGGSHSEGLSVTWGNTVEEGAIWRYMDIVMPLIIDDSASLAA